MINPTDSVPKHGPRSRMLEYADVQARLPGHHRDPFDRMLVAQAMAERIPLVANEGMFDQYGVSRL